MRSRRRGVAALLLALLGAGASPAPAAAQPVVTVPEDILTRLANIRPRRGGVLGLMGYNVSPDGSANALELERNNLTAGDGAAALTLGQFGFGFTWGESFPLFTEIYGGYARYDPRYLFTGGERERRYPLRWNNLTTTIGVGWDFRLGEYLWLRPILNGALGYATSDAGLFGQFIRYRTGRDVSLLTDQHVNAYGLGGSLVLAYYDHRPARDIDVEIRYTQIHLESFGDTFRNAQGSSIARTVSYWGRLRWPTGWEAFGRPLRWVIDTNASWYVGQQQQALGFAWALKVGGGIEFDIGRHEIGAMGITASRVRLIGRYFYGDGGITGTSFGVGVSF